MMTPRAQPGLLGAVAVASAAALDVTWTPPHDIEWSVEELQDELQVVTPSASDGVAEIQSVTTEADTDGLSGYFTLELRGETTEIISVDALAEGEGSVKTVLERLSSSGEIEVSRDYSSCIVHGVSVAAGTGKGFVEVSEGCSGSCRLDQNDLVFVAGEQFRVHQIDYGAGRLLGSLGDFTTSEYFAGATVGGALATSGPRRSRASAASSRSSSPRRRTSARARCPSSRSSASASARRRSRAPSRSASRAPRRRRSRTTRPPRTSRPRSSSSRRSPTSPSRARSTTTATTTRSSSAVRAATSRPSTPSTTCSRTPTPPRASRRRRTARTRRTSARTPSTTCSRARTRPRASRRSRTAERLRRGQRAVLPGHGLRGRRRRLRQGHALQLRGRGPLRGPRRGRRRRQLRDRRRRRARRRARRARGRRAVPARADVAPRRVEPADGHGRQGHRALRRPAGLEHGLGQRRDVIAGERGGRAPAVRRSTPSSTTTPASASPRRGPSPRPTRAATAATAATAARRSSSKPSSGTSRPSSRRLRSASRCPRRCSASSSATRSPRHRVDDPRGRRVGRRDPRREVIDGSHCVVGDQRLLRGHRRI